MANENDFVKRRQDVLRARALDALFRAMRTMREAMHGVVDEFAVLADKDLPDAFRRFPEYVDRLRHAGRFSRIMVADLMLDRTMALADIITVNYALLDHSARRLALDQFLAHLDAVGVARARRVVAMLQDPLLIVDLVSRRPAYWTGCREVRALLRSNPSPGALAELPLSVVATPWVALAVMTRDESDGSLPPLPLRVWYRDRFPWLFTRTLTCAAWLAANRVDRLASRGLEPGEALHRALSERHDPLLHDSLRALALKRPWL